MVAIRREELTVAFGRAPPISVQHCGKHIQNLIAVIAFFKMGRNFFEALACAARVDARSNASDRHGCLFDFGRGFGRRAGGLCR